MVGSVTQRLVSATGLLQPMYKISSLDNGTGGKEEPGFEAGALCLEDHRQPLTFQPVR